MDQKQSISTCAGFLEGMAAGSSEEQTKQVLRQSAFWLNSLLQAIEKQEDRDAEADEAEGADGDSDGEVGQPD